MSSLLKPFLCLLLIVGMTACSSDNGGGTPSGIPAEYRGTWFGPCKGKHQMQLEVSENKFVQTRNKFSEKGCKKLTSSEVFETLDIDHFEVITDKQLKVVLVTSLEEEGVAGTLHISEEWFLGEQALTVKIYSGTIITSTSNEEFQQASTDIYYREGHVPVEKPTVKVKDPSLPACTEEQAIAFSRLETNFKMTEGEETGSQTRAAQCNLFKYFWVKCQTETKIYIGTDWRDRCNRY